MYIAMFQTHYMTVNLDHVAGLLKEFDKLCVKLIYAAIINLLAMATLFSTT